MITLENVRQRGPCAKLGPSGKFRQCHDLLFTKAQRILFWEGGVADREGSVAVVWGRKLGELSAAWFSIIPWQG